MRPSALRFTLVLTLLSLIAEDGFANGGDPLDWPYWRGPEMNGISREKGLPDSWSPEGENLLWASKELASRSTPIVMNGKIYLLARSNPGTETEGEKIICADAKTGKILWQNTFNVYLSDVPDTRVAWSNVTGDPETGNVFALGVCGKFQCIDGKTGKTVWQKSLHERFGLLSTYGGRTNTPIIAGDLVIVSAIVIGWGDMAKPADRYIAFDKRNGQPVWFEGTRPLPFDTTYSSPVLAVANGTPVFVTGSGDGGVHAFQPQTGKRVWTYNVSRRGINTTPVIAGNMVLCGHSEENLDGNEMGALFALDLNGKGDISKTGEFWRTREWYVGKSSPVVVNDRIYAIEDKGNLLVVDAKTGERIQRLKVGTMGRASILYADGKLYCCEGNGREFIFKLTEDGLEKIHYQRLDADVAASPIVSHGRIYITTGEAMYCIGKTDHEVQSDPRPELAAVADVADDTTPAHVQIVPVESLLKSGPAGQRQLHQVRLYNSRGQYLRTAKPEDVTFNIEGPGAIDAEGRYTTPQGTEHGAVVVTAKVGELTGNARIRVIPDFPWTFNFDNGEVPITWVGARYRNIVIDYDLFKKLEGQSETLSRLYVYLRSEFVNFSPTRVWDNTTPKQRWTVFLRFTKLLEAVRTIDDAKATIDPMLTVLKDEGVVSEWSFEDLGEKGLKLTVKRGEDKVKGNGVMCKITTIPKGARSQGWMGRPNFSKYTIQADVYSAQRDGKQGDVGVIGQRYRLDLMGAAQTLKVGSWIAHESKFNIAPFEWSPNTWYTLKLSTTIEDRKGTKVAILKGKVWPRGEDEPEAWTVTWEDTPGNEIGSPGLFGNAKDAEIFFDNVKLTQN